MGTPSELVDKLMSDIGAIADDIQDYVRHPGADFTRMRKMGAGDVIRALVCMGAGTLGHELDGFLEAPKACTPSAFCQQRAKIEPEALLQLLLRFGPGVPARAADARGIRLAAVDGSEVVMQRNPRDAETHSPKSNGGPREAALGGLPGRRPGGLRAHGPVQLLLGHGGPRPAGRRRRTARGAQARPRRELRGRRAGLPRGPVAARRARRRPPREDRGERLPGQAREELREAPQALVPGELRLPLLDSARRYGQCYHARRFRASAKLRARTCDPCLAKLA